MKSNIQAGPDSECQAGRSAMLGESMNVHVLLDGGSAVGCTSGLLPLPAQGQEGTWLSVCPVPDHLCECPCLCVSLGYCSVALLIECSNEKAAAETLSLSRASHLQSTLQQRETKEAQAGAAGNDGHL